MVQGKKEGLEKIVGELVDTLYSCLTSEEPLSQAQVEEELLKTIDRYLEAHPQTEAETVVEALGRVQSFIKETEAITGEALQKAHLSLKGVKG